MRKIEEIVVVQVGGGKVKVDSGGEGEFLAVGARDCLEGARGAKEVGQGGEKKVKGGRA